MDFPGGSEDDFYDELYDDYDFEDHEPQRYQNISHLTEENLEECQKRSFTINLINGKVAEVLSHLDKGLNVNGELLDNWTPILLAASVANYDLIEHLHKRGADVMSTRDGETTLMLACKCPKTTTSFEKSNKVIELLLQLGVNPNAINRKRMNALMYAANNGNLEAVKLLLPISDLKADDNQNWNALFWAVCGGNVEVVEYLIDKGLPFDKIDVRGNTPLDIAKFYEYEHIQNLFMSEEDNEDLVLNHVSPDFESMFRDLQNNQRPKFFSDTIKILYGTRCENLANLFAEKEVDLFDFLTSTDDDFKALGVQMPFQRRRLLTGIYRFHKHPYHPKSIPTVGKDEIYSNIDTAAAVLSAIKQLVTMEASLKYITNNVVSENLFLGDEEIRHALTVIERRIQGLKLVATKLEQKAKIWDYEIEEVNIITSKSGKRWFPWKKMVFTFGVIIISSFKLWNER